MTILQDIDTGYNWELRTTENFRSVSPAGLYGINPATTTGLTLGYLGGAFNGVDVTNGTVALTASNTNYVVAHRTTGAVTAATNTTNWNNTGTYLQLYQLVAGASTFTIAATSDKRQAIGAATSGGAVAAEDVTFDNVASGLTATDVQAAIDELAGLSPAATVQCIPIACSDETTALTTGTAKVTFRMPFAFTLTAVRASVTTAPTGSVLTVDINESGTTILSTKLTIDASEKTSTTAATPPVISDTSLADDAEMTIDIDGVGSTVAGAGLKVYLIGTKT